MAAIDHSLIVRGRPVTVTINDETPTLIVAWDNIKDGVVELNEEIKGDVYEVEDGTEIPSNQGRKAVLELSISELDTTNISAINGNDHEIKVETDEGGANDTGVTITITAARIRAFIQDLKTRIRVEKTTSDEDTLPYTITDNAP